MAKNKNDSDDDESGMEKNTKENKKQGKEEKNKSKEKDKENGDEDKKKTKDKEETKPNKDELEGEDADGEEKTVAKTDRSSLSDKPQDFQMRVKVICGRQLAGSNLKPTVKVKVGKGQSKSTRCRKGTSPIWNELIMFSMNLSPKELYDSIVEFTVNNSRKLRSDGLIGSFKLDLGNVYDQPGHAYVRKWLLLTDLEDASNNPTGYLKATICILGSGDQPPDDKSDDDDDDDVEGNLLTPAGAALKSSNFCLRVFSAEDLPQMSESLLKMMKIGGSKESSSETAKKSVSPYFALGFAGKKRKTKKAKGTNCPEWNVELNLPFKFPSMCDGIKLSLKNKVKVGSDDIIGTSVMLMSTISSTGEGADGEGYLPTFGPTFVNFYGSPREYSEKDDALEPLNAGKGEGCAYRGRAMVQLITTLEEEGEESVSSRQEINEEALEDISKYYRRRRYRLVVSFESASMMNRNYEDLEFEISMGNYGNKFDMDAKSACSVTEPTSTVFDDCRYHFVPWTTKKPIVMLTSQWEDINFRLYSVNFILWICDKMKVEARKIRSQIRNQGSEVDVASSLVDLLDFIILQTSKHLPDPKDHAMSNELDSLLYDQRAKILNDISTEATKLREECTDPAVAMETISQFCESLQSVGYEPQNSIPDIIIWMISGKKRIAYHRIPAREIIYSQENPHYSGKFCSKPQNLFLKVPNAKPTSKKRYQIPCQIRISAWLGLLKEQADFDLKTDGKITICAETYEVETKIPIKGWTPDGFKDKTGEISLPKESFSCPVGWKWDGDWEISSELHLLRDAGHSDFMEECFEYENRFEDMEWDLDKIEDSRGRLVKSPESIVCPKGWTWEDDWTVDTSRACDEDGWEYSAPSDEDLGKIAWQSVEKDFHLVRRRRMIRYRKVVDPKLLKKEAKQESKLKESWEYANTSSSKFHLDCRSLDMARRRKWIRRMVTREAGGADAIFNLDKSVVKSWSFLESLQPQAEPPLSQPLESLATGSHTVPTDQSKEDSKAKAEAAALTGQEKNEALELEEDSTTRVEDEANVLQKKSELSEKDLKEFAPQDKPTDQAIKSAEDDNVLFPPKFEPEARRRTTGTLAVAIESDAEPKETEEVGKQPEHQKSKSLDLGLSSSKLKSMLTPRPFKKGKKSKSKESITEATKEKSDDEITTLEKRDSVPSETEAPSDQPTSSSKVTVPSEGSAQVEVTSEDAIKRTSDFGTDDEELDYSLIFKKSETGADDEQKKKVKPASLKKRKSSDSKFKSLFKIKTADQSADSDIDGKSDVDTLEKSNAQTTEDDQATKTPSVGDVTVEDSADLAPSTSTAEKVESVEPTPVLDSELDAATVKVKSGKKNGKSTALDAKAGVKMKKKLPTPKIYVMFEKSYNLQLRAYVYQGRDLLPMAKNNFSDPVIFVSYLNHCRRSVVANHTLNPLWDQTLVMDITLYGDIRLLREFCSQVVLEVFHANEGKKMSITPFKSKPKRSSKPMKGELKLMGRAFGKPVMKFDSESSEQKARLDWLDVNKADVEGGNILAAFDLFMKDEEQDFPVLPPRHANKKYNDLYIVPEGIRPVLQRTAVEVLIWGVRNMQPFKMLNVNTPLVLIQIGDVEFRTKPMKSVKKHPNFTNPFHFVVAVSNREITTDYMNLPVEEVYFPPIVIRVKDNRKFGRRPTVGQHIITNVKKYRREPLQPKLNYMDEDADAGSLDEFFGDVAIEMEKPEKEEEKIESMFDRLKTISSLPSMLTSEKEKDLGEADDIDWWSKYYASLGDTDKSGDFEKTGLCHIKVYKNELEKQEEFDDFSDYIETFKLSRGKSKEDEDPEFAGEFKGAFRLYKLPEDPDEPMPPPFYELPFPTYSQDLVVRVYVVQGIDISPQNSNGLADPYIKIKSGKKRIDDKKNYVPNTLNPTFGRMFELEVKIPVNKDIFVQVYDWNLIGVDDKIGETVIDLENRLFSKYRACCGLPEAYETSGPTPWRDQMTPKEMLYEKARREGWDEPVWNGNTCMVLNRKCYRLSHFESTKKPSPYWGEADERLCLHILRQFSHVTEHVETRPLFSRQMPGIEQGRLQLWIDMFPKEFGPPREPFDISPRKPSKYYCRVIIWNCSDIPMVSKSFSGDRMTDIYLKGWLSGLEYKRQKTDVHYRSMDGTGNFNWRFIFPFDYIPQERLVHVSKKRHLWSMDKTVTKFPPVLNIQVWNNDLFKPNEYLSAQIMIYTCFYTETLPQQKHLDQPLHGEVVLPLLKTPKCCKFKRSCKLENIPDFQGNCKMEIVSMFDQKLLKGWWPLYKVIDGNREQCGKLEMSVEIVTEEEHEERPAAKARKEPNENPKLDKPKRPATSFAWFSNPLKSLRYIIWRRYKWYIIAMLILLPIVAFIVLFFYNTPSAILRLL